ncbi:MAG: hypothetical protein PHQ18_02840 [Patescibacteria group bacterium]|nr:hypothetical protein [Patescibacteria group bacterium]
MNEQTNFTTIGNKPHTPIYIWIILVILLFSVAGSGTLYFLQSMSTKETTKSMQTQIASLKNDVAKLQQEKIDLDTNLQTTENKLQEATFVSSTDPLFYSLDGVLATVKKEIVPFNYTAENLESRATECSAIHETGYFDNLINTFKDTNIIVYTFTYTGEGQAPNSYTLKVLPNKMRYKTFYDFKNDFDMCAAGGEYTARMDSKWLLIESSCGSGYSDGSEKRIGCTEIREKIMTNLELN